MSICVHAHDLIRHSNAYTFYIFQDLAVSPSSQVYTWAIPLLHHMHLIATLYPMHLWTHTYIQTVITPLQQQQPIPRNSSTQNSFFFFPQRLHWHGHRMHDPTDPHTNGYPWMNSWHPWSSCLASRIWHVSAPCHRYHWLWNLLTWRMTWMTWQLVCSA